jgi:hypothetical protein
MNVWHGIMQKHIIVLLFILSEKHLMSRSGCVETFFPQIGNIELETGMLVIFE